MPSVDQLLLLADVEDVFKAIFALLIPLLWVVKQIYDATQQARPREPAPAQRQEAARQAAERQAAERQAQQRPARGQFEAQPEAAGMQGRAQAPGDEAIGRQADPLRDQVEEFLRRHRSQERARPEPPGDIEILIDEPAGEAEKRRAKEAPRAKQAPPPAARTPDPQQPARRRGVAPRPRKTLAERAVEREDARLKALSARQAELGRRVIEEDARFDVALQSRFDHKVGTLAAGLDAAPVEVPPDTPAAQIASLLASPEGVRQAIIVNEILRRPSERW